MKPFNSLEEIEEATSKCHANIDDGIELIAKSIPFIAKQLIEINMKLAARNREGGPKGAESK